MFYCIADIIEHHLRKFGSIIDNVEVDQYRALVHTPDIDFEPDKGGKRLHFRSVVSTSLA